MSKVILHIGTHKTATTTIQDTFWRNAELLAEHGLVYPRLGKATGHHGLVYDWGNLPKVYALPEGSRAALSQIAEKYGPGEETVFLSSEEFSRAGPGGEVDYAELRNLLSGFDEIEVICVLRTQWQFIQSVYLELSKKVIPHAPPVYVDAAIKNGTFAGLWADYGLFLDQLEQVFAPEEITLFDFETCRKSEGGIVGTLLRHLGVGLGAGDLKGVNNGASNVSPMSLASWAANILSAPRPAPAHLVRLAAEILKEEYGDDVKPTLFTREEFRRLKDHFDPLNEELNRRLAGVQPDFRLSPASADGLTLFREDVKLPYWIRFNRWFVKNME